jgi:hypothetical protein
MDNDKVIEVVRLLYEKTTNGELVWERTGDDTQFEAAFANFGITLLKGPLGEPELWLHNEKGEVFETFTALDAANVDLYEQLKEMYEKARRQALGVDKSLDELLKELKKRGK